MTATVNRSGSQFSNAYRKTGTAQADSVWVEDGALVIQSNATWNGTAWNNLTSGAVFSQHKQAWKGPTRVCVRAKLPGAPQGKGAGIWPAHWLMPNDKSCWPCHGEIDIMEMINGDGILEEADGHTHTVSKWVVAEADGHTHDLTSTLYAVGTTEIYKSFDDGEIWSSRDERDRRGTL